MVCEDDDRGCVERKGRKEEEGERKRQFGRHQQEQKEVDPTHTKTDKTKETRARRLRQQIN